MADFFASGSSNKNSGVGGVFNGTDVKISLGSSGGDGLAGALVQDISIQYQRSINRINEIGSDFVYYVVGTSQGNASLSQILGPSAVVRDIMSKLADVCEVQNNILSVSATQEFCGQADGAGSGNGALKIQLIGPILTSVSVAMSVQNMTIVQQAGIEFASLELT